MTCLFSLALHTLKIKYPALEHSPSCDFLSQSLCNSEQHQITYLNNKYEKKKNKFEINLMYMYVVFNLVQSVNTEGPDLITYIAATMMWPRYLGFPFWVLTSNLFFQDSYCLGRNQSDDLWRVYSFMHGIQENNFQVKTSCITFINKWKDWSLTALSQLLSTEAQLGDGQTKRV